MSTATIERILTQKKKRADRVEREAQKFADEQADVLARRSCRRDDPMYTDLSEEEFQKEWEESRDRLRIILLATARYRFGPRGQIKERITDELIKRCGNKKLAQELVSIIDFQKKDERTLMNMLTNFLGNSEICTGADVNQQWEEFVEPYLEPESVSVLRDLREKRRQIAESERRIAEIRRQTGKIRRQREEIMRQKEELVRRREVVEQEIAELAAEATRLRAERDFYAGSKRPADGKAERVGDEEEGGLQDDGKRARGVGSSRG